LALDDQCPELECAPDRSGKLQLTRAGGASVAGAGLGRRCGHIRVTQRPHPRMQAGPKLRVRTEHLIAHPVSSQARKRRSE
jgi:hypothetical protein